jgi:hypothetical protein
MKNATFWDVAPCGSSNNRRFGGTCRLFLQNRKNTRERKALGIDDSQNHWFTHELYDASDIQWRINFSENVYVER